MGATLISQHKAERSNQTVTEQLAEKIDRTVDTIGNIETGRASTKIETVCRLADALGVELGRRLIMSDTIA